ncbi:MAG: PIG-L family deacetylase [Janthinobacterium lividum]
MKIVVVSPHRDDAALSLALSIDSWLARRHAVQVLNCFTRSEYAPYSDVESLHANDRSSFVTATRKREDMAWNKLLNRQIQFTDLDMFDAPTRLACTVEETLTLPIRAGDRAVARVAGALAKLARVGSPETLAIALPLGVGGQVDHRVVRQAGLEALAGTPIPIAFYEDLPYAARPSGAAEVVEQVDAIGLSLQPAFADGVLDRVSDAVLRKRRVAECYDSQIDSEVAAQVADFCIPYGGRERVWANAAWIQSVLGAAESSNTSA